MGDDNPKVGDHPNLDDEADLRRRIAEAIIAGGGVSSMSERTGIPVGTMSKYSAKTSTASFTNAAKIALAAEIGLDKIAFGNAPLASARIRALVDRSRERGFIASSDDTGMIRLPVYNEIHASAGPGAVPASEQADGVVAFERRFLRDRGAVPDKCSVIWARGTSMKPTIPDGSILVVDHSQRSVEDGCIYVFNVSDRLVVKRARWRMGGKLELVSDNAAEGHPVETFGPDAADDLRVVGRVVYLCRTP